MFTKRDLNVIGENLNQDHDIILYVHFEKNYDILFAEQYRGLNAVRYKKVYKHSIKLENRVGTMIYMCSQNSIEVSTWLDIRKYTNIYDKITVKENYQCFKFLNEKSRKKAANPQKINIMLR